MNKRIISYILGWVLMIEGIAMQIPMAVGLGYGEKSYIYFLIIGLVLILVGGLIIFFKPQNMTLSRSEGFAATALSWIVLSVAGALPLYFSGAIPNFMNAVFEAVSGFTTTGATILVDIEALDKCMLFWRAFTHFIGGMGVIVFLLAIIPKIAGTNSINLMKAESTGTDVNKTMPNLRVYAAVLYSIYIGLTVLEIIFLSFGGMNLFDAITTAFSTAGTGGFASYNNSIAHFDSYYLQTVIAVFMMLFGVNFYVYILILTKRFKQIFKMTEVWVYFGIVAVSTIAIAVNIIGIFGNWYDAIHQSFFYVTSIISTTGVSLCDTNIWPQFSKVIILVITCIGACAGSTGGGFKVSRIIIICKEIKKGIMTIVHPRQVYTVKVDGRKVSHETTRTVSVFLMIYIFITVFSFLIVSLDGFDLETNFTSVLATLNNVGPGFGMVGSVGNYSQFSMLSKFVFCFDMIAGRLELYPLILLLTPSAWKKH